MTERKGVDRARLAELTKRATELIDNEPGQAAELAEAGLSLARDLGDDVAFAGNLRVIAECRIREGDYSAAEGDLRRALDLARSGGDSSLAIRCLRGLVKCAFYTRNQDAALLRGQQALQLARDSGDRMAEALTHNDLGLVYGNVGDFEGALEHLLAGLRLLRETGARRLASLQNNIGNVHLELGDHREALSFFESAVEGFREEGNDRGEGIALGNVGRANIGLERPEAARDAFAASVLVFERLGDDAYRAPALARLGTALTALGEEESAEEAFEQACDLVDRSPQREFEDEILFAAARFHLSRDDADRGIELLNRAIALLPADEASRRIYDLHAALAEAFERRGDPETALHHFKEFHRIRQSVGDSATALRIRGLMLQFDVEQARQQEEIFRLRNIELARANEELQALQTELEARNRELQKISTEDPLTGLHNRRYLQVQLGVEIRRALRHRRPLCVAMCDIDHFKPVNDRFSHTVGDQVLRQVGAIIRDTIRVTDVGTRFGGEEFLLILPDTELGGGEALARRLLDAVILHPWQQLAPGLVITMSVGVAQMGPEGDATELLTAADARLYQAKRNGRARVVAA